MTPAALEKTKTNFAPPGAYLYLFKEAVLILVFLYLFIFNGTSQDFTSLPVVTITTVLATAAGLAWLLRGRAAPTPLGLPLLIFACAYLLAALVSVDARRSLEDFGWLLWIVLLFAFFADLAARNWSSELIIKALLVAWSVVLAFTWIAPLQWTLDWISTFPGEWLPEIIYRPPMPNTLAMSFNVYVMLALARLLHSRSWVNRVVLGCAVLAALALLFLTSSRAGWIGTAAGFACLGGWFWLKKRPVLLGAWQRVRSRRLVLTIGGLVFGMLALVLGWLLYRQTIHPTHGPLFDSRKQFWGPAIDTFRRHPILGQGPNTMSRSLLEAQTLEPGMVFVHAHSTPLNLLAETGLVGLTAAGIVGASLLLALRRRWKDARGSDAAVVLGASAALAAYAVHSLFDSFQTEPVGLWFLAIAVGAALGKPSPQVNWRTAARPWWVIVPLVGLWVNLWLVQPLIRGVEAMNSNRPAEAAALLEQAATRDPNSAIAWQQLGLVRAALAKNEPETRLAIQALERARQLDPAWDFTLVNLGALYRAIGDLDTARRLLEQSLRLADMPVTHLNLAVVVEAQGDLDTARREYALALAKYDGWWEGEFWQQSPLRLEIRAAHLQSGPLPSSTDVARMEADLAAYPSSISYYLPLIRAYLDLGDVEKASHLLQRARFISEVGGIQRNQWLNLSARLYDMLDQPAEAAQARQQQLDACLIQGFSGPGDNLTLHYAVVVFRKPAIAIEMVPQVERMPCP